MRRWLVTGGAGFIGGHFVRRLAREEAVERLCVLDALTYAGSMDNLADLEDDPRFVFVHGDVRDRSLVVTLLAEHGVDAVAHLAAETHVDRSIATPEIFVESNVLGTSALLETCRRHCPDVRPFRFLFVSTDEVFGSLNRDDPPFTERSPWAPNSPYAASKAAGDALCRAYYRTYGFPVIVVNGANNYGPRQFPEKLIPLAITRLLAGQPVPLYGQGDQRREWLYVEDFADGLFRAASLGRPGETYLLGAGEERENREVIARLIELLRERGLPLPTPPIERVPDRPGHDVRYASNIEKARRELGWRPTTPWEEGTRRTVDWHLRQAALKRA